MLLKAKRAGISASAEMFRAGFGHYRPSDVNGPEPQGAGRELPMGCLRRFSSAINPRRYATEINLNHRAAHARQLLSATLPSSRKKSQRHHH